MAMAKLDYQNIINLIQIQIKENPTYPDLHYQMALFQAYYGNYTAAKKELSQSILINPNYSQAIELKKTIYSLRETEIVRPNQLKTPPICFSEVHNLASIYFAQNGQFDLAKEALEKSYAITKDESDYHLHLGLLEESKGDLNSAITYLTKALEMKSQIWLPYFVLSQIYAVQDNLKDAGDILKRGVDLFPNFADLQYHLGLLKIGESNFEEAVHHLSEAVEINPTYIFAHYHLGNAYMQSGNSPIAEIEFSKTIELGFNEASIYLDLARAQYQNGKYTVAEGSARNAIILDSSYVEAYHFLAEIYDKLGKFDLRDRARESANALITGVG